ncbi:DUF5682 family protein, partial [Kitasatospora sp. NPDC088134]|uniref:DUF5682 family protein n=1 Tax=Kitasatospora sp. NPDC088134 TaxID=3364071 RepID=UPI003800E9A5
MHAPVPAEQADALAGSGTDRPGPYLIGVRHHAPSITAVLPALLAAARPDVLLVELPAEFQPWLDLLAAPATVAPVALAAATGAEGATPAFYPFADFSPELAALRWAAAHGVPAVACDLPLGERGGAGRDGGGDRAGLAEALRRRLTGRPDEDLWDRLVEAPAPGCTPEAVRRAALLVGWALRHDTAAVDPYDLRREAWMRARIRAEVVGGRRVTAVVGAFHAPALLPDAAGELPEEPFAEKGVDDPSVDGAVVSLIPYTYPLLDARSGYPAGIRDPEWQHAVLAAGGDPERLAEETTRAAVRICEALRAQGHPAGPADGREIVRLAGDLARLRGLPAPGRGELIEAVQTVLAQGEPLGRGRAVARALEQVLVGTRTGRPTPAAPRTGLGPAVEAQLAALGLPGPADTAEPAPRDLRLDPLRTPLDARRELLLRRLEVCGVPYGEPVAVTGAGGTEALGSRWRVRWTPATAAMLTVAGLRGVTAAQAAEGTLRERLRREQADGGPTARQVLDGLAAAADCALPGLARTRLDQLAEELPASATLPELLDGLALLDRLTTAHPAAAETLAPLRGPAAGTVGLLTAAAVRGLEGLTGSDDPADARALVEFARRADPEGGLRLGSTLRRLADDGSPLVRGAAGAARVLLGHQPPGAFGERVVSWVDTAASPAGRTALGRALTGLLTAAEGLLGAAPAALDPLLARITELPDDAFLSRLPALRGGFDTLSPAARDRLLAVVEERLGTHVDTLPADLAPTTLATLARADLAARRALVARGLLPQAAGGEEGDKTGLALAERGLL